MKRRTGRSSAIVMFGWGLGNTALLVVLMGWGGDSLEGSVTGASCMLMGIFAAALYMGRARSVGATVVRPVTRSGWSAFFLGVALVLLGMGLPFGAWPAVVAPVPLFVSVYLYLAARRGTRPTLESAEATPSSKAASGWRWARRTARPSSSPPPRSAWKATARSSPRPSHPSGTATELRRDGGCRGGIDRGGGRPAGRHPPAPPAGAPRPRRAGTLRWGGRPRARPAAAPQPTQLGVTGHCAPRRPAGSA